MKSGVVHFLISYLESRPEYIAVALVFIAIIGLAIIALWIH